MMKTYQRDRSWWLKTILMWPVSLVKLVALRHTEVIPKFGISVVAYMVFVVLDLVGFFLFNVL